MENQLSRAEHKLAMIMQHASMGLVEMDRSGAIVYLNAKGDSLLRPIWIAHNIDEHNLYAVLEYIAPSISKKIKESPDEAGLILQNDLQSFFFCFGGETIERHFSFTVIKIFADCIIVGLDDITQKKQQEQAIRELLSSKGSMQCKFEIASNVLHDIGNAVVGFGSYANRIKRTMEQHKQDSLEKLAIFFVSHEAAMSAMFGQTKADALVKLLRGVSETQKNNEDEINKSIDEQLNIIVHIKEILNIQRQYVNGQEIHEKKPVKLSSIIDDCRSMLFASLEKRGIGLTVHVANGLPVIQADRTTLMQVILNLLKNSIEAIDPNASDKHISVKITSSDGFLELHISDNGHGFDEATGRQLCKRGFTTKASGSGLGLDHSRAIIEKHAGSLDISSPGFGKGAQVAIKFKI